MVPSIEFSSEESSLACRLRLLLCGDEDVDEGVDDGVDDDDEDTLRLLCDAFSETSL